jgi:hypothetical protein
MLLSEQEMARRIDFERNTLNRRSRYGLSIKDEAEFRQQDLAARWLKSAEQRLKQPSPKPKALKRSAVKHPFPGTNIDLDPYDPHDQLPGVDMSRPPW